MKLVIEALFCYLKYVSKREKEWEEYEWRDF